MNKKPKIILISAKARHGKDQFAEFFTEYTEGYHKSLTIGYGDAVKNVCESYFGCTKEKNDENRSSWQHVGTDVARANYEDVWVDITIALIKGIGHLYDYILIKDVRFENEISKWKEEGYETTTIRIHRTNFDNGLSDEQKNHPSETSLDNYPFDYVLLNDGTLNDYKEMVCKFINSRIIA